MWVVAAVAGLLALVTCTVSLDAAGDVVVRLAPILVFFVAVTVLSELGDASGLLDVAARECARRGRGSTWRLWLLVVALATLSTVLRSLDSGARQPPCSGASVAAREGLQ